MVLGIGIVVHVDRRMLRMDGRGTVNMENAKARSKVLDYIYEVSVSGIDGVCVGVQSKV